MPALVAERAEEVRRRIASAGGDPEKVVIVAVTKGFGADAARAAGAAGLVELGENYADELVAKAEELRSGGQLRAGERAGPRERWHFLGAIQRNKVARLAPYVSLWQGVDRVEEAVAIARHAPGASVLVEVDASGLPGRGGVPLAGVEALVGRVGSLGLVVRGLMTIAPPVEIDRPAASRAFDRVGRLVAELGLEVASMGMSADLELAVAHGATMVRVGTALFGPRPMPVRVSQ